MLPGRPWFWTVGRWRLLLMPVFSNLLFSLLCGRRGGRKAFGAWARETASGFVKSLLVALLGIVFLVHQALLSLDAIVRSILRVFVHQTQAARVGNGRGSRKRLRKRKSKVDVYLEWSPWIALAIAAAVWLIRPGVLRVAAPILSCVVLFAVHIGSC